MGEIIFSIIVGACLFFSGLLMNIILDKEAKKINKKKES